MVIQSQAYSQRTTNKINVNPKIKWSLTPHHHQITFFSFDTVYFSNFPPKMKIWG